MNSNISKWIQVHRIPLQKCTRMIEVCSNIIALGYDDGIDFRDPITGRILTSIPGQVTSFALSSNGTRCIIAYSDHCVLYAFPQSTLPEGILDALPGSPRRRSIFQVQEIARYTISNVICVGMADRCICVVDATSLYTFDSKLRFCWHLPHEYGIPFQLRGIEPSSILVCAELRNYIIDCDGQGQIRPLGSKVHKGFLPACPQPGQLLPSNRRAESKIILSARPNGRLWVAERTTGAVQTTLKFAEKDSMKCGMTCLRPQHLICWSSTTVHIFDLDAINTLDTWTVACKEVRVLSATDRDTPVEQVFLLHHDGLTLDIRYCGQNIRDVIHTVLFKSTVNESSNEPYLTHEEEAWHQLPEPHSFCRLLHAQWNELINPSIPSSWLQPLSRILEICETTPEPPQEIVPPQVLLREESTATLSIPPTPSEGPERSFPSTSPPAGPKVDQTGALDVAPHSTHTSVPPTPSDAPDRSLPQTTSMAISTSPRGSHLDDAGASMSPLKTSPPGSPQPVLPMTQVIATLRDHLSQVELGLWSGTMDIKGSTMTHMPQLSTFPRVTLDTPPTQKCTINSLEAIIDDTFEMGTTEGDDSGWNSMDDECSGYLRPGEEIPVRAPLNIPEHPRYPPPIPSWELIRILRFHHCCPGHDALLGTYNPSPTLNEQMTTFVQEAEGWFHNISPSESSKLSSSVLDCATVLTEIRCFKEKIWPVLGLWPTKEVEQWYEYGKTLFKSEIPWQIAMRANGRGIQISNITKKINVSKLSLKWNDNGLYSLLYHGLKPVSSIISLIDILVEL